MMIEAVQESDRAFQRIVRMLNASEQSSVKVREKLARAGFEGATVEEAVDRARRCGIIDDHRYAEVLVRSAISQGKGFCFVRAELDALGIALDEVEAYQEHEAQAAHEPSVSDEARAMAFLETYPPRAKNLRDAAFRKLMSKGYGSDLAMSVARRWSEARR